MFIIIETKTEKYLDSCGEYQQKENGYIVNDCVYSLNWAEMKEIEEIPTEVKPQKYCYNATDGFYLNPNYVEPIDPNQELIDLKAKVTQQDEIIVQLLIDSLMGGA